MISKELYINCKAKYKIWRLNNVTHRDKRPAVIYWDEYNFKFYWERGVAVVGGL
jgi:hypothetical protein